MDNDISFSASSSNASSISQPTPSNRTNHANPPSKTSSSANSSYTSYLKPKTMLKLWPSGQSDQTTPKARAGDRNPFDDPKLNTSSAPTIHAPCTPTGTSFQQHHLLHPGNNSSNSNPSSPSAGLGPSITSPITFDASTPGSSTIKTVTPTTHVSLHAPVFTMQQPPQGRSQTASQILKHNNGLTTHKKSTLSISSTSNQSSSSTSSTSNVAPATSNSTSSSKGQLHLKLISARSLNVSSHSSRPYVVVQYDNNEFVSREPIAEFEKEAKGSATKGTLGSSNGPGVLSRNSSASALSALGAINILTSKKPPKGVTSTNTSPSSSVGSVGSTHAKAAITNAYSKSGPTDSSTITASGLFSAVSPYNPVWKHEVSFDVTSDTSVISLNIYDRACDEASSSSGFLGTLDIKPILVHDHTVDDWYALRPHENEKVTGSIRVQTTYEQYKTHRSLTPRDFEFLKLIGRGTFGRVFQVRKKDTKRIYAMKVLSKREIVAKKEVAHTIGERKILQKSMDSPFLVGLKFSFQTDSDLFLVTDFKSGGELFWHLQKDTRFPEDRARFYIAELILALEHLHKYDIVYRDLKPENILLDATGHIALCDFGLSKADLPSDQLTNTFCGTTEYLAPEVLLDDHGYSKLVDFWSLGVLLFEMCCGWSPFYAEDTQQMYKNICFGKIKFPRNVINDDGKQFVKGLLNRNPKHRLGAQRDAAELKEHPFFKTVDWNALALKQVTPPFIPEVESDESVANFDPEFTGMSMADLDLLQEDEWDDEDPSGAWVESASLSTSGFHSPNGPLGSDMALSSIADNASKKPIEIKQKKKPPKENPLSSSVQDNFKGFSYTGESLANSVLLAAMHRKDDDDDDEGEEDAVADQNTEDELEDDSRVSGRYARRKLRNDMEMD